MEHLQVRPRSVEIESEPGAGHRAAVALFPLPRAAELGRLCRIRDPYVRWCGRCAVRRTKSGDLR